MKVETIKDFFKFNIKWYKNIELTKEYLLLLYIDLERSPTDEKKANKLLTDFLKQTDKSFSLSKLCNLLQKKHPALFTDSNLVSILTLSTNKVKQLYDIVKRLSDHNLLNQQEFDSAFRLTAERLPDIQPTTLTALKRLKSNAGKCNDQKYIFENGTSVYSSKSDGKSSGGFGEVSRGYSTYSHRKPTHAIKNIFNCDDDVTDKEKEFDALVSQHTFKKHLYTDKDIENIFKRFYAFPTAPNKSSLEFDTRKITAENYVKRVRREVKHLKLLGRDAFFFHKSKECYVVAPWSAGHPLMVEHGTIFLAETPTLHQSAKYILELLNQLNILHEHYRVHGDLSPLNIIIDEATGSVNIIDLGCAYKVGSKYASDAHHLLTLSPTQRYDSLYDFRDDMYALGLIAAALTPDLFSYKATGFPTVISRLKLDNLTPSENFLYTLVDAMTHPDRDARCTCRDALTACTQALDIWDELSQEKLDSIYRATLLKKELSADDVVHMRLK